MSNIDTFKLPGRRPPRREEQSRHEPTFEGDRKARGLGEIARDLDENSPTPPTGKHSDFAPPEVRHAVQNLEEEIGKLAVQERQARPEHTRDIGNSADMKRAQEFLNNTITVAHEDACRAVDKIVEDARALVARLEKAAEIHKAKLKEGGLKIAVDMESAMQALNRTVEMVEQQSPDLQNPKLTLPSTSPEQPKGEPPPRPDPSEPFTKG